MVIRGKCVACGDQEFKVESDNTFRLAVPWLSSFLQREIEYARTVCGQVRQWSPALLNLGDDRRTISLRPPCDGDVVKQKHPMVMHHVPGQEFVAISYPAVFRDGENVLLPTSEGNVQDATVVDRYGDPDLMADFAEEYLRQFRSLMPTGRLPGSLKEVMPALLLLVTATELAVKAFLIRSEKPLKASHSLVDLYERLAPVHKQEAERRFAGAESNLILSNLGADGPKIADLLRLYSQTYGGESSAYMDVRYCAEPTTRLHGGSSLVKGNTPYPIFLPDVVRALIDTYWHFSGPERLRRLGADILEGVRESGNDNHGVWGLIPSSLDLLVVSVPQKAGKDAKGEELKVYEAFKMSHPTRLTADWMYGGNTLFFYRAAGQCFPDGQRVIDGLECRVWSRGRLGLHPRELNRLVGALEVAGSVEDSIGRLTLGKQASAVFVTVSDEA